MKKLTFILGVVTLIALVLVVSPAIADSREYVEGTYSPVDAYGPLTFTPHGANCIIEVDADYPFTGDMVGHALIHFVVLVHGPCDQALPFAFMENYWGTGTFSGEVLGHSGTLDLVYKGKGWPAALGEQAVKTQIRFFSGTGELENVHGNIDVSYNMGDSFDSYTGWLHFDE